MAEVGIASRRACEEMIEAGRVEVNGEVVSSLPVFVDPHVDRVVVDGRPLPRPGAIAGGPEGPGGIRGAGTRHVYIMLNKPARTLSTTRDEGGRRTVLDLVRHPSGVRLYPVGRLGFDATGLVLLTNDGELANRLTHARYGVPRTYRIEVKGSVSAEALHGMEREMSRSEQRARKLERGGPGASDGPAGGGPGARSGRVSLSIVKHEPGRTVLEAVMAEGKNRQVERVLGEAGHAVRKLGCTAVGPVELSGVAPGEWRELEREEVRALRVAAKLVRGSSASAAGPKKKKKAAGRRPSGTAPVGQRGRAGSGRAERKA